MNIQKGSATIVLVVVLVVVLAVVLVYFAFLKKPGEVAISPTPTPTMVVKTVTPTPTQTAQITVIKGWLEGTVENWTVVETTLQLSGYSGRKFKLQLSNQSTCIVSIDNQTSNSFSCNSENPPSKWGYGDRVRVYGNISGNNIKVSKMEIVSALPIANW